MYLLHVLDSQCFTHVQCSNPHFAFSRVENHVLEALTVVYLCTKTQCCGIIDQAIYIALVKPLQNGMGQELGLLVFTGHGTQRSDKGHVPFLCEEEKLRLSIYYRNNY